MVLVRQWNLNERSKDCVRNERMVLVLCDGEMKRLSRVGNVRILEHESK